MDATSNVDQQAIIVDDKSLSVMLTFTCPAACKDCGTRSHPKERATLTLSTAKSYIKEAASMQFKIVVFTGGEATLRWNDLNDAIRYAKSFGLKTRLVTNAHWATRAEVARAKIDKLVSNGLDEINYSTGDEHVRFVPMERVATAIVAALERGLSVAIMIEARDERKITRDVFLKHPKLANLKPSLKRRLSIVQSPWMPLDPMTLGQYAEEGSPDTATFKNVVAKKGCSSIFSTYTIQPDGRIGCCCGLGLRDIPELNVGDLSTTLENVVNNAEADLVKLAIKYIGPSRLVAWAAEKDTDIKWSGMYAHHCQTCRRLYTDNKIKRIIRAHSDELSTMVLEEAALDRVLETSNKQKHTLVS